MTITISKNNPNLHILSSTSAIYLTSDDTLMKDDIAIIQDGRSDPEKTFEVTEIIETTSKGIKTGYSIANLQIK
jgi:hypothetical protein